MAKKKSPKESDVELEEIKSEEQDQESSPVKYEIVTYPADYTLEVLVKKLKDKQIAVPPFQRRFVWSLTQSSKLVESFLLGLPVPPIFLYVQQNSTLLVVDGQQRLKSIAYFFEGLWGEEVKGKRPVFRLTGLNPKSPFADKTMDDLKDTDYPAYQRLNDAVLRSFQIKQLDPKDDTSIYHVFERLNTGGSLLRGQEIRNCIYHGTLNETMLTLNAFSTWRAILGKPAEDPRRRDVELILRFLSLHFSDGEYEKPMKDFMSVFMSRHRNPPAKTLKQYQQMFQQTITAVFKALGEKPFHIRAGLNVAAFDAVTNAFASHLSSIPTDIKSRYQRLLKDTNFVEYTTYRTTDDDVVTKRLRLAAEVLFGK